MALVPPQKVAGGYPLGLTGATAATRYVGATASGAPASGTFAVGDFAIDQTGSVYICTVAGTPGTWVQVGAGLTVLFSDVLSVDTATIDSGAAGIAQTKTHLWIIAHLRTDNAVQQSTVSRMRFNNDAGASNYGTERMYASDTTGGVATKDNGSGIIAHIPGSSAPANMFGLVEIVVPYYTNTTRIKNARCTFAYERDTFFSTGADIGIFNAIWNSTAAISRLAFACSGAEKYVAGSSVTVYGL